MKYSIIAAAAALSVIAAQCVSAYDGPQVIGVHNTDRHGIYVTVGGAVVGCDKTELPFIDESGRTQVPVRAISEALEKDVAWNEAEKTVEIKDSENKISFVIGSADMLKNGSIVKMDTAACIVDGHTFIPLRFLGEALGCEVEYTTADRFGDITVKRIWELENAADADIVTVWGNIQDIFHESGGMGSMRPYEGENPDIYGGARCYELTFGSETDNEPYKTVYVYWDYINGAAYLKENDELYTVDTGFARFLNSLVEGADSAVYAVDRDDKQLFKEYGWTADYKLNTVRDTLPQLTELGEFSAETYYFNYNNELSKDIGLDMSGYAGKDISADIYYLHESMPAEFFPTEFARGVVIKYNGEVIGAYISSGRHFAGAACSLKGRSFEDITGEEYGEYLEKNVKAEDNAVVDKPEEIIQRYFDALIAKDSDKARSCLSKEAMFGSITTNMPNTELYNREAMLPLSNNAVTEKTEGRLDNIKSVGNLRITPVEDKDTSDKRMEFTVEFDIEYEKEESLSGGEQWMICTLVYESDKTGWKIVGFGY